MCLQSALNIHIVVNNIVPNPLLAQYLFIPSYFSSHYTLYNHMPSVSQAVSCWPSTLKHVNKGENCCILTCADWLGSAETQDFPGRGCVWSRAGQSFVVMCGAMKYIWTAICLLCLAASIQHFTAHKISSSVCSVTVWCTCDINWTNVMHGRQQLAFLSYRYVPRIFVLVHALEFLCNFSKHQTPYTWCHCCI